MNKEKLDYTIFGKILRITFNRCDYTKMDLELSSIYNTESNQNVLDEYLFNRFYM